MDAPCYIKYSRTYVPIRFFAEAMGMSRSLLHTKMKSLMNTSAGDYIRHKRIQKACQMITDGYNVSETAYSCGFADPNYFSKVFKKMVGVAPSEYLSK